MQNIITIFFRFLHNYFVLKSNLKINDWDIAIQDFLESPKPCMIARFGSTELKAVLYPKLPFYLRFLLKNRIFYNMNILSGFFPINNNSIRLFSNLMIEDIKLLDILGSWRFEEFFLRKHLHYTTSLHLTTLEPYFNENPWSEILENKNVLVIHPFNRTIENQYFNKRKLLFNDPRVLPQFKSLQTIKAVQTLAGNKSEFKDWFEALDYMKFEISKLDFDIAIIGCGAYGFPLAAHVKRLGKKAVHLGGPTQILFGIKGKRWLDNPKFDNIINEHFVFPSEEDQVVNSSKVENSCYW